MINTLLHCKREINYFSHSSVADITGSVYRLHERTTPVIQYLLSNINVHLSRSSEGRDWLIVTMEARSSRSLWSLLGLRLTHRGSNDFSFYNSRNTAPGNVPGMHRGMLSYEVEPDSMATERLAFSSNSSRN